VEADDCCEICAEVNGQIFDLDEIFETHPNCRGAMAPIIN
jgi:hypothetical protein